MRAAKGVRAVKAVTARPKDPGPGPQAARPGRSDLLGLLRPLGPLLLLLALDAFMPDSPRHPPARLPYLRYALFLALLANLGLALAASAKPGRLSKLADKGSFGAAVFLILAAYDLASKKTAFLPSLFFPAPDRVISVLIEDFSYLTVTCLGSSARLLFTGFFSGALVGLATGISIGFSKTAGYWLNPVLKILGPIPPTAWIPVVLVAFPTTWSGAAFLIALSVWFPTTLMTSSGILNVQNAFFEVSSTLGASRAYQIFRVGIPAAMPLIFTGLFSGACASFLTLMTAEMVGVKNGIGWYINWQREMLSYANVYAGLIVIAVTFYALITLFFKVRDRLLVWQKGMIKW